MTSAHPAAGRLAGSPTLQIVIPAYNEEQRLPRTLRLLRRHLNEQPGMFGPTEVIVVDNGSADRTADVARAASGPAFAVRVVECPVRGKGAAVRAGVLATDAEVVAFMDADGATALDALNEAWSLFARSSDVVIGSRRVVGTSGVVRHGRARVAGAACYRSMARLLVPGVSDTQCGFKVMRGDLARRVASDLRSCGFSFDVELLMRLRAAGARIDEIAVSWVDVPGSTFGPVRHGAAAFMELARIAWRMRRSEAVIPALPLPPVPVAASWQTSRVL